jgi:hypothetical protein
VLGLWVLQVEIRVDGVPFYRVFLPKSWLARTPFHFIYKRIQVCVNQRSNRKGEDLLCHPKRVRYELSMEVDTG